VAEPGVDATLNDIVPQKVDLSRLHSSDYVRASLEHLC
jgi:hypothetical protein